MQTKHQKRPERKKIKVRHTVIQQCDLNSSQPQQFSRLQKPKLQSITSITYIDTAGATQTWTSTLYEADIKSDIGKVRPVSGESYPSTDDIYNAVTIKFKAGYGDAAA